MRPKYKSEAQILEGIDSADEEDEDDEADNNASTFEESSNIISQVEKAETKKSHLYRPSKYIS